MLIFTFYTYDAKLIEMLLSTPENYYLKKPRFLANPHGWIPHIPIAFFLTEVLKPGLFVELGTYSGNSYFAFCQAVKDLGLPTRCVAVDTWQGDMHVGNYGTEVYERVQKINTSEFANFSSLIKKDFNAALSDFHNQSIDLLHIDGTHTLQAVKNDFKSWLPKMAPGGIILLHDTLVKKPGFEVWKYLQELQSQYPVLELPYGEGLAVVCADNQPPATLEDFFREAKSGNQIIHFFEMLGKNILLERENSLFRQEVLKTRKKTAQLNEALLNARKEIKRLRKRVHKSK